MSTDIEHDTDDRAANARGLKVHLRFIQVGRRLVRVITLRQSTTARYSTNFFHNTWHLITDREGAYILARLLWGLAFQRHEGTIVVIDEAHLTTTPFEADRPDMIVVARAGLARLDGDLLRTLKQRLRRNPPVGKTVRWHTFGLPSALAAPRSRTPRAQRDQMSRLGGFLCYSASAETLRAQALAIYAMRHCTQMDYHYLADGCGVRFHPDGEVQVFRDFDDMVSAAAIARRAVVSDGVIRTPSEREAIYRETERTGALVRDARRRRKLSSCALAVREKD